MEGYEGLFGLMMAECERKRAERRREIERSREELSGMALVIAAEEMRRKREP